MFMNTFLPTIIHENYHDSPCFYKKRPQKMLDLLKDILNSHSSLFNVVPNLKELCQDVVARNEQNKKFWKEFLKVPERIFLKRMSL